MIAGTLLAERFARWELTAVSRSRRAGVAEVDEGEDVVLEATVSDVACEVVLLLGDEVWLAWTEAEELVVMATDEELEPAPDVWMRRKPATPATAITITTTARAAGLATALSPFTPMRGRFSRMKVLVRKAISDPRRHPHRGSNLAIAP